MAIENTTRKTAVMQGDGVSVKFPFSFRIGREEDLVVYVKNGLGAFEEQILNEDYELTDLITDANGFIISGNISYPKIDTEAEEQPAPLTSDDYIYGIRETPRNQLESSDQVSFKSKDIERGLDKACMQIQELTEDVSRCIKTEEWQDIDPDEILESVYDAAANAAVAAQNASGSADTAQQYANNASQQATAAAGSALSAASSALDAAIWAEGTDAQVSELGGTHSSKRWAQECQSIAQLIFLIDKPLLSTQWLDYQLNDSAWLNSSSFDWYDGTKYTKIYNHLVNDITGSAITAYEATGENGTRYVLSQTPAVGDDTYIILYNLSIYGLDAKIIAPFSAIESISGDTITDGFGNTFTLTGNSANNLTISIYDGNAHAVVANDGHKISMPDEATTISDLYDNNGIAWYYILDVHNKRFKLPRTKFGFTGYRNEVGGAVSAGLPNITGNFYANGDYTQNSLSASGAFKAGENKSRRDADQADVHSYPSIDFDASSSNTIYGNSDTVQPPATQMYLYFYAGQVIESD